MDADKPQPSINLVQYQREQARALYAVKFDMARTRQAANKARKVDQNVALNRIQPSHSEKAKSVWQSEGGSTADERIRPLSMLDPMSSHSWSPWGFERS
jgi:hypothetical protein